MQPLLSQHLASARHADALRAAAEARATAVDGPPRSPFAARRTRIATRRRLRWALRLAH